MKGWWLILLSFLLTLTAFIGADEDEIGPIRFAVIGDRTGGHIPGVFGEVLEQIERLKPEFILTVGDLIEGYTEDTVRLYDEWNEFKEIISRLSTPIYLTTGNHDIYNDVMDKYYREHIGEPYYSFDYKRLHFIILENGRWEESDGIPAKQMEWLIEDLKASGKAYYTLVIMHKPFWYHSTALGRPDTLHTLFKIYGVDAVFSGHFHQYFTGTYDDIIYTNIGSSGGHTLPGPSGLQYHFCWVTVDENGFTIVPIEKDAVRAWNDVQAEDLRTCTHMRMFGFKPSKVALNDDLKVDDQTFMVTIDNIYSEQTIDDTLIWDLPTGWSIEPAGHQVNIAPGQSGTYEYTVSCAGNVYPLPRAAIGFNYRDDRHYNINVPLLVARQVDCGLAGNKPKIDGKLKEDIWHNPVTNFYSPEGGFSEIDPTEFYFAYDKNNLYIAAKCTESMMDSMVANVKEQDGAIYGEDCIGYFFQPDVDIAAAYQIYINPLGTVFDQKLTIDQDGYYDGDRDWNGKYEIKTNKMEGFWTVEASIPLNQFAISGEEGKKCGINFRRKQRRLNSAADWQQIDYDVKTYGVLTMK